jgi:hypothetical protein
MIATIADNVDLDLFWSEVYGAGFAPENMITEILSVGGHNFVKVMQIMDAVLIHITTQSTPEMVTRKFNTFVLLLHDKLKLDELARELTQALGTCLSQ